MGWLIAGAILTGMVVIGSLMGRAETKRLGKRRAAFGGTEDTEFAALDLLIHAAMATGRGADVLLPKVQEALERLLGKSFDADRIAACFALAERDPDMMDLAPLSGQIAEILRPAVFQEAVNLYLDRRPINPEDDESAIYLKRLAVALGLSTTALHQAARGH